MIKFSKHGQALIPLRERGCDFCSSADGRRRWLCRSWPYRGCSEEIYRKIIPEQARKNGPVISSVFPVRQGGSDDRKQRSMINLNLQSIHWRKGTIRMEGHAEFACSIQKGDFLFLWKSRVDTDIFGYLQQWAIGLSFATKAGFTNASHWLFDGQVNIWVYPLHGGSRTGVAQLEYSGTYLPRLLPYSSVQTWNFFNTWELPQDRRPHSCPSSSLEPCTIPQQLGPALERQSYVHSDSCSYRCQDRYCCSAFQNRLLQAPSCEAAWNESFQSSPVRKTMDKQAGSSLFLRRLCLTFFGHAICRILYPLVALGHSGSLTTR